MHPDHAKTAMHMLLSGYENEIGITRKVIAAVPAEKSGHKLHDRSMSAMELAWHIPAAESFFATAVVTGTFPAFNNKPENIKTPADVLAWYDAQVANHLPKLKAMTGEQIMKVIDSPFGPQPGIAFLQIMINHTIHHRGQLSTYLRPMGAKVPSIYGHSRDDKEAKEAAAKA
jgi:uncharacterized damage-inducible protein DinB